MADRRGLHKGDAVSNKTKAAIAKREAAKAPEKPKPAKKKADAEA